MIQTCRLLLLSVLCLFFLPQDTEAVPEIANNSFEADGGGVLWPGIQPVTGWITVGNVGINPLREEYRTIGTAAGSQDLHFAFANNGRIPDRQHVLYLQSTQVEDVHAQIQQDNISGFEANKTYVLVFFENRRQTYGSNMETEVRLGSHEIVPWHVVVPVDAFLRFENPYHRRISREFTTNVPGPHKLVYSTRSVGRPPQTINNQVVPILYPDQVQEHRRSEGSVLVDNFYFVELADLALTTARRNYLDRTQIMAAFSKDLPDSAMEARNFILSNRFGAVIGPVASVRRGANNKTVVLTAPFPLENEGDYELMAEGVIDVEGKGMFRTNSVKQIDLSPRMPADFSENLNGYEDDFNGSTRHPAWRPVGPAGDIYRQYHGVLKVGTGPGDFNHLVYAPEVPYDGSNQEVLARIRILKLIPGTKAGVSAAVGLTTSEGISWIFSESLLGVRQFQMVDDGRSSGPAGATSWSPNGWYWVRLRHQPGVSGGDVLARSWPADLESPEPENWQVFNYSGAAPRAGLAGIAGGIKGVETEFEVDYILIRAAGLPALQPTPPAAIPVSLSIQIQEENFHLIWRQKDSPFASLEVNHDLANPFGWEFYFAEEEFMDEAGNRTVVVPKTETNSFFRLRF